MAEPVAKPPRNPARARYGKPPPGKKLLRMWVIDPDAPGFREQLARDLAALKRSKEEKDILDWGDAVLADIDLPPYEWTAPDDDGTAGTKS